MINPKLINCTILSPRELLSIVMLSLMRKIHDGVVVFFEQKIPIDFDGKNEEERQ